MAKTKEIAVEETYKPIGKICKVDKEENTFEKMIRLWLSDKITYDELLEHYPQYDSSMINKIAKFIYLKSKVLLP
jgi:hypothetical protein